MVQDFRHPKKLWIAGNILKQRGPLTYDVQIGQRQVRVHVYHLRASEASASSSRMDDGDFLDYPASSEEQAGITEQEDAAAQAQPEWRYLERQRTAPKRLNL